MESKHHRVSSDIQGVTEAISKLKQDNRYLTEEADTIQRKNNEYMDYLSNLAQRRHNSIITLNDYNHQKLQDTKREKEEAAMKMREKENQLRTEILSKEYRLSIVVRELEQLRPYQELQAEHLARIKELKSEMIEMRAIYNHKEVILAHMFNQNVESHCREYVEEVAQFRTTAIKKARHALQAHTKKAKKENIRLRQQLLRLVQNLDELVMLKCKLQRHNQMLLLNVQLDLPRTVCITPHKWHVGCFRQVVGEDKVTANQEKVRLYLEYFHGTDRLRAKITQTKRDPEYPHFTPQPQADNSQTYEDAKYLQCTSLAQPEKTQANREEKNPTEIQSILNIYPNRDLVKPNPTETQSILNARPNCNMKEPNPKQTIINVHPDCDMKEPNPLEMQSILNVHPDCDLREPNPTEMQSILNVHPECDMKEPNPTETQSIFNLHLNLRKSQSAGSKIFNASVLRNH